MKFNYLGYTDEELLEADFTGYNHFRRALEDYRTFNPPENNLLKEEINIIILFGEPGTGKSQWAKEYFKKIFLEKKEKHFRIPCGSKNAWFTKRANGCKHLWLDDFKRNVELVDLLQLLDPDYYPIEFNCKGSFVWCLFKTIIFTTNISPWDWYKFNYREKEREALFRRFTQCFRFEKNEERKPKPFEISIYDEDAFKYSKNEIPNKLEKIKLKTLLNPKNAKRREISEISKEIYILKKNLEKYEILLNAEKQLLDMPSLQENNLNLIEKEGLSINEYLTPEKIFKNSTKNIQKEEEEITEMIEELECTGEENCQCGCQKLFIEIEKNDSNLEFTNSEKEKGLTSVLEIPGFKSLKCICGYLPKQCICIFKNAV